MKIKGRFIVSEINGENYAVSLGSTETFHGMIRLNETGRDIFQGLLDGKGEEEIAAQLLKDYENVDIKLAKKAVDEMVEKLRNAGIVID